MAWASRKEGDKTICFLQGCYIGCAVECRIHQTVDLKCCFTIIKTIFSSLFCICKTLKIFKILIRSSSIHAGYERLLLVWYGVVRCGDSLCALCFEPCLVRWVYRSWEGPVSCYCAVPASRYAEYNNNNNNII